MNNRIKIFLLSAVLLAVLLPFSNRAFFIDDWFYYDGSKGLAGHLLRPYDFVQDEINGPMKAWDNGQKPWLVSPPAILYFTGLTRKLFKTPEGVRRAFLVFPLISALCMFFIAGRFTASPFFAALVFMFTPAFLITSVSMSPDSLMLAFLLASVLAFITGCEKENTAYFILSGILAGFASFSKYTGLLAVPITLSYVVFRRKLLDRKILAYLAVSAGMFLFWCAWNILTYGKAHFIETLKLGYISSPDITNKVISQSSFFSASLVFPVFCLFFILNRKNRLTLAAITAFTVIFFLLLQSRLGGFPASQSLMIAVCVSAAIIFLKQSLELAFSGRGFFFPVFWFVFTFLVMIKILEFSAGRYFMIISPAACLILAITAERHFPDKKRLDIFKYALLAATVIIGVSALYADRLQAGTYKRIASDISKDNYAAGNKYFNGNSFMGFYGYLTESGGWKPLYTSTKLQKGDLVLLPRYSAPVILPLPKEYVAEHLKIVKIYEYNNRFPLRDMNKEDSAGFYSSFFGTLPFVISTKPLEKFYLFQNE